jgi:hypothetical protein
MAGITEISRKKIRNALYIFIFKRHHYLQRFSRVFSILCKYKIAGGPFASGAYGALGVTGPEGLEAGPVPMLFFAVTVNVQEIPLARPFTVIGPDRPEAACPVLETTVYKVMRLPPFEAGALKLTVALALPAFTPMIVGASGFVAGVTLLDLLDHGPSPMPLVALTVKV